MIPNIENQHVETAVRVRKRFGKAFVEADVKSFASRARSKLIGIIGKIGVDPNAVLL